MKEIVGHNRWPGPDFRDLIGRDLTRDEGFITLRGKICRCMIWNYPDGSSQVHFYHSRVAYSYDGGKNFKLMREVPEPPSSFDITEDGDNWQPALITGIDLNKITLRLFEDGKIDIPVNWSESPITIHTPIDRLNYDFLYR